MLLSKKVSVNRIISGTWKYFVVDICTCIASYFAYQYFVKDYLEIPPIIPTILGTALSFFIGFNNNQAYDRWWEARKIWGALVNVSRNFSHQVVHFPIKNTAEIDQARTLHRQIAFTYALNEKLRKNTDEKFRMFIKKDEMKQLSKTSNLPNSLLSLQMKDIQSWYDNKLIDGHQLEILHRSMYDFYECMGKSERIANTVFPTTYNYYTRIFIWIFIIMATMVSVSYVGHWSILIGALIGYVFLTTSKIGEALLNPFENIPTGIPLNQITRTIEINILESMNATGIPPAIMQDGKDYVM